MTNITKRTFLKLSGTLLGGIAAGTTVTAAERTDRFIVSTQKKADLSDLTVIHEMPGIDYAVVRGAESDVKRSVSSYAADVQIELDSPEVNEEAPTLDESDYEGQPGDFLQWDKTDLDVPEAHETTEGEGTRVSVIDSGVLETHPDLAGPLNLDLSKNFTDDGRDHNPVGGGDHGTHVAGIVAADNGGGIGVNGTAPKTDLVDCRVFSGPTATFADILAAVVYSANIDADVANLSLGAYPVPRQGLGQFYGAALNSAMTYANKEGTLLVIAAGNDSADLQHDNGTQIDLDGDGEDDTLTGGYWISLPNEGAQAVSVSATGPIGYGWDADGDGDKIDVASPPESPAFYTNYGTNAITLGAPGGDANLGAIGTGVPWFYDLVFNTVFVATGEVVSGTIGSKADEYEGDVTAERTGDYNENVTVTGQTPYTEDNVSWYESVGYGGVRFDVSDQEKTFEDSTEITVTYEDGPDQDRPAPDWIVLQVTVGSEDSSTDYVIIDWQVDELSDTTVSWAVNDSFGDTNGRVYEAKSVEDVIENPNINPANPNASPGDVLDEGTVQTVGVFSGGGLGRDDSVEITYEQINFDETELLFGQVPGYGWKAGTSMAAPNVAGAAALVKSANPNYNANQVEAALKRAADVPENYDKTFYGSGYLNIIDAL